MKKYFLVLFILIVLAVFSIYAINRPDFINPENTSEKLTDTTLANPKVDIKVNKEYDKNGNVIRYDSSYTYIYTYPNGSSETLNIDSIFNNFRPYFFNRGFNLMQKPFIDYFDSDSSFQQHFFDHDYFIQQFEKELFRFEEMMHEMDSLRNIYLREIYPEIKQNTKPTQKKTGNTIEI